MTSKTTNNLNSKFTLKELSILEESKQDTKLNTPCLLVLHRDKRTMTKEERESYSTRRIKSYCSAVTNNIFLQPNVSRFILCGISDSRTKTYYADGKCCNLYVIFTVDTMAKNSEYNTTTYRVEFKDKESLLRGLRVYIMLVTQDKDKILRRKLRAYFTALALL